MKTGKQLLRLSRYKVMLIALLLIGLSLPVIQWRFDNVLQMQNEVRRLKIERLQLVRALDVLKAHPHVVSAVSEEPISIEMLSLSLVESMNQYANANGLTLTQLTITEPKDTLLQASMIRVQVHFSMLIRKAMGLLALFDVIKTSADWQPIEIRDCTLVRSGNDDLKLLASCSIDVYLFADSDQ